MKAAWFTLVVLVFLLTAGMALADMDTPDAGCGGADANWRQTAAQAHDPAAPGQAQGSAKFFVKFIHSDNIFDTNGYIGLPQMKGMIRWVARMITGGGEQ